MPLTAHRADHRTGVEPATIDAHRAAPAAADLEGRFDDRVARQAGYHRLEIRDYPGRAAAGHTDPPRWSGCGAGANSLYRTKRSACMCIPRARPIVYVRGGHHGSY